MGRRRVKFSREFMYRLGNWLVISAVIVDKVRDVRCLNSDAPSWFQDPTAFTEDLNATVVCEMLDTLLRKDIIKTPGRKRKVVIQIHVNAVQSPFAALRVPDIGVQPVAVALSGITWSRGNLKYLGIAQRQVLFDRPPCEPFEVVNLRGGR